MTIVILRVVDKKGLMTWRIKKYERPVKISKKDWIDVVCFYDQHNAWDLVGIMTEGENIKEVK